MLGPQYTNLIIYILFNESLKMFYLCYVCFNILFIVSYKYYTIYTYPQQFLKTRMRLLFTS